MLIVSDSAGRAQQVIAKEDKAIRDARSNQFIASRPIHDLSRRLRRRPSGISARKQTPAEERAFQRAITVHAAAAKTGGFAGGVEAPDDLAIAPKHARVQIGLETAQ